MYGRNVKRRPLRYWLSTTDPSESRTEVFQRQILFAVMLFFIALSIVLLGLFGRQGTTSASTNSLVDMVIVLPIFIAVCALVMVLTFFPRLWAFTKLCGIVLVAAFPVIPVVSDLNLSAGFTTDAQRMTDSEQLESLKQQSAARYFYLSIVCAGLFFNIFEVCVVYFVEVALLIVFYLTDLYSIHALSGVLVFTTFFLLVVVGMLVIRNIELGRAERERANFASLFHSSVDPIVVHQNGRIIAANRRFDQAFGLSRSRQRIVDEFVKVHNSADGEPFSKIAAASAPVLSQAVVVATLSNPSISAADEESVVGSSSTSSDAYLSVSEKSVCCVRCDRSTFPAKTYSVALPGFLADQEEATTLWTELKRLACVVFGKGASKSDHLTHGQSVVLLTAIRDQADHERMIAALEEAVMERSRRTTMMTALNTVAHELKSPLWSVVAASEVLSTALPESSRKDPRVRELMDTILRSANMLVLLINDVLDRSKMERGAFMLAPTTTELSETVDDVMDMVSVGAVDRGVNLTCYTSAHVPRMVHTDPLRLKQVLWNLLSNAIKFTPAGGTVHLEIGCTQDSMMHFSVSDSGRGIDPDQLAVLSRFEAWAPTTAPVDGWKMSGTGLGLSIAHSIVTHMGGKMDIQSEPKKGTTVSFSVPRMGTFVEEFPMAPPAVLPVVHVLPSARASPVAQLQSQLLIRFLQECHWNTSASLVTQCDSPSDVADAGGLFLCAPASGPLAESRFVPSTALVLELLSLHHRLLAPMQDMSGNRFAVRAPFRQKELFVLMGLLYRRYCSSVAEIVDDSRSLPETDFPQLSFPELPANTSVSVAQPPVPITSPPSSNHEDIVAHSPTRLLIVDDDHVNRRITVQLAQRSGFLSMDAKDGWDAMLILARNMSCSLRLLFQEGNLSLAYYDASLSALQQICHSRIMQLIRNGKVDAKQQQDALDALNRLGSEPAPAYETVVVEIHCGSQVLCVLRWFLLDVALVDQNMPIMNGSDFAQLVRDVESSVASIVQEDPQFMKFLTRARCSLVQLALVRFSADTLFDEEDIFTDALPKPCRKAELEAKLREVANRFLPSINAHSSTELVMN